MSPAPDWHPTRTVDAARAAELVGRARPQLRGVPCRRSARGLGHHPVPGRQRQRGAFPTALDRPARPRPRARRPAAHRAAAAPAAPVPEWTGTADDPEDPWPFVGTALIEGREPADAGLPDDAGAAGVIDWGDVGRGDPAVDLAIRVAAFGGRAREAFRPSYGPVGPGSELGARALAVRLSALLARYAAAEDRPALLAEAVAGLRRAVA